MMKPRIAITADAQRLVEQQYLRRYKVALGAAGAQVELLSHLSEPAALTRTLEGFDGLLLPGGADVDPSLYGAASHPSVSQAPAAYDQLELEAARIALRQDLPTFGICRGVQVMNVALGGTLWVDVPEEFNAENGLVLQHRQTPPHPRYEATHPVDFKEGSMLARIVGSRMVATNSMHHQALRVLAHDLIPVGRSRDGIVEAVEARTNHPFFVGVQWHPEEMYEVDEPSRLLFGEFVQQAEARARRRNPSAV